LANMEVARLGFRGSSLKGSRLNRHLCSDFTLLFPPAWNMDGMVMEQPPYNKGSKGENEICTIRWLN